MKSDSGNENIYKLTQKYRSETQNAYETTITNLYLTEAEYNHLKPLEAKIIRKKRYPYEVQHRHFSIDIFAGRHQGLILAEMGFEKESESGEFPLPLFALKEVTDDPFFTGGHLVIVTDEEVKQGLSHHIRDH